MQKEGQVLEKEGLKGLKDFGYNLKHSSGIEPPTLRPLTPKNALPATATGLRIWQHSYLRPLKELPEELQDRILILRNHPKVCAMSHKQNVISYTEHQDYLRELKRKRPKYSCCALYCEAIQSLTKSSPKNPKPLNPKPLNPKTRHSKPPSITEEEGFKILRPIIGIVSVDLRIPERPLLGLYKNLYHYPYIRMGRILLFASMLHASELGLKEVFLECYSKNIAMQQLANQLGFQREKGKLVAESDESGKLLSFQRPLPSGKNLLQDPMFSDFGELHREFKSLGNK